MPRTLLGFLFCFRSLKLDLRFENLVAISKEPSCTLSFLFLCDAAVVMETDLGVAVLRSGRDSLIWRVTAGHYHRQRAFIKCFAPIDVVQSLGLCVWGACAGFIGCITPMSTKQISRSSVIGALKTARPWQCPSCYRW